MSIFITVVLVVVGVMTGLQARRWSDNRHAAQVWADLERLGQRQASIFDPSIYRLQPFGGFLSEFRDFDGYRLPTRVEGGNFIGTEAYFPFYKAQVDHLRFVLAENSEDDLRTPKL